MKAFEDVNQPQEILDFCKKYSQSPQGFLLLVGKNGTGKSFLANAIYSAFSTCDSDEELFISQTELNLKWQKQIAEWKETTYLLNKINYTKILVLDDIGTRKPTDAFMDFLYAIVDERYRERNSKGTVITTNMNSKKMRADFGDAFVSRIASGKVFRFDGEDRRFQQF